MKFIGITGGVGTGKSEILNYLSGRADTRVMQADEIAKELMKPGTDCNRRLRERFAEKGLFDAEGKIDTEKMAETIFTDEKKRAEMNAIVHPAVKQYVTEEAKQRRQEQKISYLFLEAALLIEEHYDKICDELWYVYTSMENRKARLMQSRSYSEEKVAKMFESQLSEAEYRSHCNKEIDNNGTKEETINQVVMIINSEGDNTDGTCK